MCGRFPWASSGSSRGSWTAPAASAARGAGASFLRRDGSVWTTDKDGPILNLLAAEITARTDRDPGEHYRALAARLGTPCYRRIDAPASPEQKARLAELSPDAVRATKLADHEITARLTRAPGCWRDRRAQGDDGRRLVRGAALGTEDIYKIYAESFAGPRTSMRSCERRGGS